MGRSSFPRLTSSTAMGWYGVSLLGLWTGRSRRLLISWGSCSSWTKVRARAPAYSSSRERQENQRQRRRTGVSDPHDHNFTFRRRNAFVITDRELKLMAGAAKMGVDRGLEER